ncbi:hypothetical protein [Paraburkholderia ferrariae]|uniref:hypothetical protein n=1 Tax=Paraburkholderia ferrariae TaxID=386056 RepID=UPI00146FE6B3|nr:hypothetical protein [Paraburkholderia ferrariae]
MEKLDSALLLYAVAAVQVEPAGVSGWFTRRRGACATVISREEDVKDILLRMPESWNVVSGARCKGLHDDIDVVTVDPRFRHGPMHASCAVVGHDDGKRFILLMQMNTADAVLLPERLFRDASTFEDCILHAG